MRIHDSDSGLNCLESEQRLKTKKYTCNQHTEPQPIIEQMHNQRSIVTM
jgi:hypothetical protein